MTKADKVVLTSAIVTTGSTMSTAFMPENLCGQGALPSPRLLFGSALTFAGLSMLGDFAPGLAIPLAATVGFTAVLYYGIPILDCYATDGQSESCKKCVQRAAAKTAGKSGGATSKVGSVVAPQPAGPPTPPLAATPGSLVPGVGAIIPIPR